VSNQDIDSRSSTASSMLRKASCPFGNPLNALVVVGILQQ